MADDVIPTFKLLLMGDSGTGKSSILLRFIEDMFLGEDQQAATIGVDFKVKMVDISGKRYKLTIWDTAGQERFRTLTSSYYRGAQGVILVYDVTNRNTFDNLNSWFTELETFAPNNDIVKIVIGNKIDREDERAVGKAEGAAFAKKMSALFLECSAKTNIAISQIIENPSLQSGQKRTTVLQPAEQHHDEASFAQCGC